MNERLSRLDQRLLFSGDYDTADALLTVNSGAGGVEAQAWAQRLLLAYLRWAERKGFSVEEIDRREGKEAGIKNATWMVRGPRAYGLLRSERGTHRLSRHSPFDQQDRRQTSFAAVDVAPVLDDLGDVEISDDDVSWDTFRSGGPGGQHQNKTESGVRVRHLPSGLVVECRGGRSQAANRKTALAALQGKLTALQEQEREQEIAAERGEKAPAGFGHRIRSYVIEPYQLVIDHRNGFRTSDVDGVLDGRFDELIDHALRWRSDAHASADLA
jgi:peptide chain release factor 2